MINADKVTQWKKDIQDSVDMYNDWFLKFAPDTYRESRKKATSEVREAFNLTKDLRDINPTALKNFPKVLPTLRMCTSPPLARDRLVGLASTTKNLVGVLEEGKLPARMKASDLDNHLERICDTILFLLDIDIFPWLVTENPPEENERDRAATIVADRLTGAVADPIIRNAQEERQLKAIKAFLEELEYQYEDPEPGTTPIEIKPGTFCFRYNVKVKQEEKDVNIPIDVVIQPKEPRDNLMPIFIECKSAGDFTNTNKRRKEEATKVRQLKDTYGEEAQLYLFLCGYFDAGYLGYEAAEGLDWIWEHRIEDMLQLGL
ncbi:XamI family restriction endonuclease [Effusibacillus pohliae]|uniref:XamI family restriction endonuclease n=1 Tax=Effusibacillus pohliae TaxID=232270 RepID=UPI000375E5DB|nr:XamI family restriction endonuclease [Effusibacillus pohliae]